MSFRRLGLRGPFLFGVTAVLAACASATGTGEEDEPRGRPTTAGAAGAGADAGGAGTGGGAGKGGNTAAGAAGAIGLGGEGGAGASAGSAQAGSAGSAGLAGAAGSSGGGAGVGGGAGISGSAGSAGLAGSGQGGQGGGAGKAGSTSGAGGAAGAAAGKAGSGGVSGEAGRAGASAGTGGGAGTASGAAGSAGTGGTTGAAGQSGAGGAGGATIPIVCHDPCVAGPPMDLTCPNNGIIVDACGPNGVANKECCTTGWSDTCVAFTDAVLGCAGRTPGYQACLDYRKLPAPSAANEDACSACRSDCYDLAECGGGIFGDTQLQLECDPFQIPPAKAAAVCGCLTRPGPDATSGCFGRKGAACCLSEGAVARCLATTCQAECAP